jgi:hypothetical protein
MANVSSRVLHASGPAELKEIFGDDRLHPLLIETRLFTPQLLFQPAKRIEFVIREGDHHPCSSARSGVGNLRPATSVEPGKVGQVNMIQSRVAPMAILPHRALCSARCREEYDRSTRVTGVGGARGQKDGGCGWRRLLVRIQNA